MTTKKISFENALQRFEKSILSVIGIEQKAEAATSSTWTEAFTLLLVSGKENGTPAGEMGDQCETLVETHLANFKAPKTVKMYVTAFKWAAGRGLLSWSTSLTSTEGKIKALTDAGKKIPKDLVERAEKESAKREAKHGPVAQANVENTVKLLSKAYDMAVLIGKAGWAVHIKEAIQAEKPDWTPPTAEGK